LIEEGDQAAAPMGTYCFGYYREETPPGSGGSAPANTIDRRPLRGQVVVFKNAVGAMGELDVSVRSLRVNKYRGPFAGGRIKNRYLNRDTGRERRPC